MDFVRGYNGHINNQLKDVQEEEREDCSCEFNNPRKICDLCWKEAVSRTRVKFPLEEGIENRLPEGTLNHLNHLLSKSKSGQCCDHNDPEPPWEKSCRITFCLHCLTKCEFDAEKKSPKPPAPNERCCFWFF